MNNIIPKKALIIVLCVVAVLVIFVLLAISAGGEDTIGEDEAKNAALSHADVAEDDAFFSLIELERDEGRLIYEVDFVARGYEYDYEIDAKNGAVIKSEKSLEDKVSVPKDEAKAVESAIDEETAKKNALKHAGLSEEDVMFSKVALDDEGQHYEVDFTSNGKKYEYEIDTIRGTVIKHEVSEINRD